MKLPFFAKVDNGLRLGRSDALEGIWTRLGWWIRACAGLGSVMLFVVLAGIAAAHWSAMPYRLTLGLAPGQSDAEQTDLTAALKNKLVELGATDAPIAVLPLDAAASMHVVEMCSELMLTTELSLTRPEASALFSWVSRLSDAQICGWQYTVDVGVAELFSNSLGVGLPIVGIGLLIILAIHARQGRVRLEGDLAGLREAAKLGAMTGLVAFFGLWLLEVALRAIGFSPHSAPEWPDLSSAGLIWVALVVLVLTPLVEEYAFRFRFLEAASMAVGLPAALVISSILFSLFHFPESRAAFVFFFLMGLVMGALWVRTRSLLVCWTAHSAHNALSMAVSVLA